MFRLVILTAFTLKFSLIYFLSVKCTLFFNSRTCKQLQGNGNKRDPKLKDSVTNRPLLIYQYSNMAPRLSGQTSIFGVVFFVSKSLLGIERQKKHKKLAILTRKPWTHARILIYRTWPIDSAVTVRPTCVLSGYQSWNKPYPQTVCNDPLKQMDYHHA